MVDFTHSADLHLGWDGLYSLVIEKLAALEHEQWVHWTEYMLDNLTEENIACWRGQIATPYEDLTEEERDSDRVWARRVWDVLLEHFAG